MATRFYLLDEVEPYTPPSWRGGWDLDGTKTRACDPVKYGQYSLSSATNSETSASNPYRMGVLRLVSRRLLNGQTISGTVNMVIGCGVTVADADFYARLHLYVVKASDGSVVGTLLNQYEETSAGGATEWPILPRVGLALQSVQTLSSVVVPNDAGDYRLVGEVGVRSENVLTASRLAGISYGVRLDEEGWREDLSVGSTATGEKAGFLEFSDDIALAADVVTNVSLETATIIDALPFTASQTVDDAGFCHTVWYRYTARAQDTLISLFAFGDLSVYKPVISVYTAPGETFRFVSQLGRTDVKPNAPLAIPVEPGTTYYIKIAPDSGNPSPAELVLTVERPPVAVTAPVGSLLIMDDTFGYPAMVLHPTSGAILKVLHPFAASEAAAVLPTGEVCAVDDDEITSGVATIKVYSPSLELVATLPIDVRSQGPVTTIGSDGFLVGHTGVNDVRRISSAGEDLGVVATLTGTYVESPWSLLGMAVSPDENTLYYTSYHDSTAMEPGAIRRWNLSTDTASSDLVAAVASYNICREVLCLADGSVLASYNKRTASYDSFVRRYDSSGATLNTYALEPGVSISDEIRLAHAEDDPASFWVWTKTGAGMSKFRHLRVSDGADLLTPIEASFFSDGVYGPAATATPEMFGHSFSCPFLVTRAIVGPVRATPDDESVPCCPCDCPPPVRLTSGGLPGGTAGSPAAAPVVTHTGAILPPLSAAWEHICTGGGDVPSAADATDAESWVS